MPLRFGSSYTPRNAQDRGRHMPRRKIRRVNPISTWICYKHFLAKRNRVLKKALIDLSSWKWVWETSVPLEMFPSSAHLHQTFSHQCSCCFWLRCFQAWNSTCRSDSRETCLNIYLWQWGWLYIHKMAVFYMSFAENHFTTLCICSHLDSHNLNPAAILLP